MPTSPDGTIIRLGQAEAIKDAAGDLWSLDPDDGTVLLNGSQAGNGRGVVIAQSLGKIYVLGEDAVTWWLWLGDSYTLHGHTVPPGITIPTVPPPLPVPRRLANIPNNPAYSVQGNNTAAPILVAHAIAADGLDIPDNAYKWKLREAGGVDFEPHTGQTWTLAGMEPNKEFWADLTVFGQTFGRGFSVSVPLNQLPVSKYSVVINGLTATFTSLSTDPDNDAIAKEEWILPSGKVGTPEGNIQPDPFGPPAFATGKTATKTYPAPGKYWVQLRVTDARGGESKPIEWIVIPPQTPNPIPQPPPATPGNPLGLTTVEMSTEFPTSQKITTGGTVIKSKRFKDARQTERKMEAAQAAQNARQCLDIQASGVKVIGCLFDNVGHPPIGPWKGGKGEVIEDCYGWNYGVLDNTAPNGSDDAKKNYNPRGAGIYGQSSGHDDITTIRRSGFWGGMRESVHIRTSDEPTSFSSGFQFEEFFAHSPGLNYLCYHATSGRPIRNTAYRRSHLFVNQHGNAINALYYRPDDVPSDIELTGTVIYNRSGPAAFIRASTVKGGGQNTFVGERDAVLHLESGDLARDQWLSRNDFFYDPNHVGFRINDERGDWAWFKAKTGATGTYVVGLPANRVAVYPSPNFPGRALVIAWSFTPQTSIQVPLVGLATGQKFIIMDTQNIDGPPLAQGTYDPTKPILTVPLPTAAAPVNPVKGAVSNPWAGKRCTTQNALLVVPV